jgi:hypothetical protein
MDENPRKIGGWAIFFSAALTVLMPILSLVITALLELTVVGDIYARLYALRAGVPLHELSEDYGMAFQYFFVVLPLTFILLFPLVFLLLWQVKKWLVKKFL